MKKFLLKALLFCLGLFIVGEMLVRTFQLVSDVPHRIIDENGIQKYKEGQRGYFKHYKAKWEVNDYGWLGVSNVSNDTIISVIGDSYIENMMNPISCNQGFLLGEKFKNISFFEAARSGMTFIEAMEITKILTKKIKPKLQLLYVSDNDFKESISDIRKYNDRVQINLKEKVIIKSKLKSPKLKKILYKNKFLYYLYLRYLTVKTKKVKNKSISKSKKTNNNETFYESLINYCSSNYNIKNIILVCHPNTNQRLISLLKKHQFKVVLLDKENENWDFSKEDSHWSCFGHKQVSKQVSNKLNSLLK